MAFRSALAAPIDRIFETSSGSPDTIGHVRTRTSLFGSVCVCACDNDTNIYIYIYMIKICIHIFSPAGGKPR